MDPSIDSEAEVGTVDVRIQYLSARSRPSRHFVSPRGDLHTDEFEPHAVKVRDGRPIADRFTLDEHGFVLRRHSSAVASFDDRAAIDASYPAEGVALVQALTGADLVVPLGWHQRSSAVPTPEGMLAASSDVHVDFSTSSAEQVARTLYSRERPGARLYRRFILTGMWRVLTEPPQDRPFAVCDARTVAEHEGVSKPLVRVDTLPEGEAMYAPIPGEDQCLASWVTPYNAAHRWWYFPNMTRDEVVLLKHYDSDRSKARRVPHTAFHDPTFPDAPPRRSIELRTAAYFL